MSFSAKQQEKSQPREEGGPAGTARRGRLTYEPGDPFGLVLPPNTHKVHRDPGQHDDHAQAAHHWFRVQTEAQQHHPEQQVADGDQQVHLHRTEFNPGC